jgi:hypothetical protein
MQPTDRDWRLHDSCTPSSLRAAHHPAHAPHHDPQVIHPLADLAEGHLAGWEAAWIDLGGEG